MAEVIKALGGGGLGLELEHRGGKVQVFPLCMEHCTCTLQLH